MSFDNILGNEKNKELLNKIVKEEKIANAYMFIGKESIGKFLFAKEFAKAILCTSSNEVKPCNNCKSCIEFDSSNNPDFVVLDPEGNIIKIEQIRELTKKVYEKPIVSNKKVYIVNNSNLMTKEAQNALLKTLEEPPEYVTIILIADNENNFLPTIKSRCTKMLFNKLSNIEVLDILKKEYNYQDVSDVVLKIADGSISKAIDLKDKEKDYENIDRIYSNIENIDILDLFSSKENLFSNKEEANQILDYINLIFFDKIKTNARYINCMSILEDTKDRIKKNNNYDMTIDNFIMTIWEEING